MSCEGDSKKAETAFVTNIPIVGRNAFTHESVIHQDGVLQHPVTFFNKNVDWQAGGINPNIARIEKIIQQRKAHPTLFSVWGTE